jgi:hypothetical protein
MPSVDAYHRMYEVFEPMRPTFGDHEIGKDEIVEILKAAAHPSVRKAS